MEFPLFVIVFSYFLQLRFGCFQLCVETLRSEQLVRLRFDLQILVLHDFLDEEFAVANFAYITFDFLRKLFPIHISLIGHGATLLLVLLDLDVHLVRRVGPLLVPTFATIL